jgi:hypothetical protein
LREERETERKRKKEEEKERGIIVALRYFVEVQNAE